jgi:hypothetical protein
MARTTEHQLRGVLSVLQSLPAERAIELRFERLIEQPLQEVARLRAWLDPASIAAETIPATSRLRADIDPQRAAHPQEQYAPEVQAAVARRLQPLRVALGYARD